MAQAEVLKWIDTASPEQLHCVATRWVWDYGTEVLQKIAEQRRCDASTAIAIFFRGEPNWYLKYPPEPSWPDQLISLQMLESIAEKLRSGFYNGPRFATDEVAHHHCNLKDSQKIYGPGSHWNLPSWVFDEIEGQHLDCQEFDEGRPPDIAW